MRQVDKKLTVKQKKFADYYIKTGNATESSIKAGYSKKTASEMGYENLSKPHIKAYVEKYINKLSDKTLASAEEILEFLTNTMRNINEDTRERIKSAELLGKRYSLFIEKINLNIDDVPKIIIDIPRKDEKND